LSSEIPSSGVTSTCGVWAATGGTVGQVVSFFGVDYEQETADGGTSTTIMSGSGSSALTTPWYWSPPLASSFTLSNNGPGNLVLTNDTDVGLIIDPPSSPGFTGGMFHAFAMQTLPAGSWTATMRMEGSVQATEYTGWGYVLRDTATSKFFTFGQRHYGSTSYAMVNKWNNASTHVADSWIAVLAQEIWPWRRIVFDSATGLLTFQISTNGKSFRSVFSENISVHLGSAPEEIGFFFGGNVNTSLYQATIQRWTITTP
jgi:hypothetical protein